jgi:hypothetical protein
MKRVLKKIFAVATYIFAVIGFVLTAGYAAVTLHLTNSAGIVDLQNAAFQQLGNSGNQTGPQITEDWNKTAEWTTLKAAITKDADTINQASYVTGVDPRLITAQLVAEQLRLYTSEREVFKQIFAPLKILGSQSQFSWGIMGLKEDTAIQIENNLKDATSTYYPGPQFAGLLDFKTANPIQERFDRLTDQHAHYYDYLYTALYLKEIMVQWKNAGFDISNRPEILSTLYNIGFAHSNPNANPSVGGAEITIDNKTYSFGSLAYQFYYSTELTDLFPAKPRR